MPAPTGPLSCPCWALVQAPLGHSSLQLPYPEYPVTLPLVGYWTRFFRASHFVLPQHRMLLSLYLLCYCCCCFCLLLLLLVLLLVAAASACCCCCSFFYLLLCLLPVVCYSVALSIYVALFLNCRFRLSFLLLSLYLLLLRHVRSTIP